MPLPLFAAQTEGDTGLVSFADGYRLRVIVTNVTGYRLRVIAHCGRGRAMRKIP